MAALELKEEGKILEMLLDSKPKLFSELLMELESIDGMKLEQLTMLKTETLELL